jgi:alkyl hydroperoxide reductase subunit F
MTVKRSAKKPRYQMMIVGAGPAGLSAAVYAARKKLKVIMLSADIGGQLNTNWGVENYLGYQFIEGPELIDKFDSQVKQFPVKQQIDEKVTRLDKVSGGFEALTESGAKYRAQAVVYATGKQARKLNVPGEKEFSGKGVTYCAICDGPLFSGQRVAVVGGGNSAVEAALDMIGIATHIDIVVRNEFTADAILVERLKKSKKINTIMGYEVDNISGDEFVSALNIKKVGGGSPRELKVSGVFVEIGLEPNTEAVAHLLTLNKRQEIPISCNCETTVNGLYAAGDVTDVPEKQIIIAAGEGAKAALQAHRYLQRLSD